MGTGQGSAKTLTINQVLVSPIRPAPFCLPVSCAPVLSPSGSDDVAVRPFLSGAPGRGLPVVKG